MEQGTAGRAVPDTGPIAPRLRQLAERYPHHFGGEVRAAG